MQDGSPKEANLHATQSSGRIILIWRDGIWSFADGWRHGAGWCATLWRVFEHYAKRVHLVPRLRERLAFVPFNLGHPVWVKDPDFDIKNHIVHVPLPEGSSEDDAIAMALELNEGVMPRDIPLWKFFVITGVPDRTYVLQQAHHAMVDGASAIQMTTMLFDFDPAHEPPPEEEPWNPPPLPSSATLVSEAMQENLEEISRLNQSVAKGAAPDSRNMLQHGLAAMSRFFTRSAITASWNAAMIGPKRAIETRIFELAAFREIRRAFGGTINDVALAAVSEGCARYLEREGENVADQHLRVMCPVNIRTEDEAGMIGNKVSAIFPLLPAYSLDIQDRYRNVVVETNRIKHDQEAQAMALMQEVSPSVPAMIMAPLLVVGTPFDPTRLGAAFPAPPPPSWMPRMPNFGVNFVITNVPGVQVPQYIAGCEVLDQRAIMMIGGNMGLGSVVTSYNQKMIISFTCEPRLLPNLEDLVAAFEEAYDELLAAAREHFDNTAHSA